MTPVNSYKIPLLCCLMLPFACTSDDAASSSNSGTTASSSTTDATTDGSTSTTEGMSSTTEGSATGTDTTGPTTTEATGPTTTDPTTAGTETTGTTTGGGSIEEGCAAACAKSIACNDGQGDQDECVLDCLDFNAMPNASPECEAVTADYLFCEAAATCEEIDSGLECLDELELVFNTCDPPTCNGTPTTGAIECGYLWECDDNTTQEMACDVDGCICFENGMEVGACANDICSDQVDTPALLDKMESCCGF